MPTPSAVRRRMPGPLLLLALALPAGLAAQIEPGQGAATGSYLVEGTVVDPGGHGITGAMVEAYLHSEVRADYGVSDIQGRYHIVLGQRSEFWELRVSAEGYLPQTTTVGIWRSVERVDFVLRPDPRYDPNGPARESRARRQARARMREGLALAAKGRRTEAIRELEQAVERDPTYVPALNNLAVQLRLAGRTAEAETRFRQAIARDSLDFYSRFNLGMLLLDTGRAPEAARELEWAALIDPASFPAAVSLARAYLAAGDQRALEAFRNAGHLAPKDVDLSLETSDAMVLAGELAEALDAKRAWLASHGSDPRAEQVRSTIARLEEKLAR
jgi:hypothetical protein